MWPLFKLIYRMWMDRAQMCIIASMDLWGALTVLPSPPPIGTMHRCAGLPFLGARRVFGGINPEERRAHYDFSNWAPFPFLSAKATEKIKM